MGHFVDQSPDELRLSLVDGNVDLSELHILQSATHQWRGLELKLYVLGASHAVQFLRNGAVFTEVLACVPPPAVEPMHLDDLRIPSTRRFFTRYDHVFSHSTQLLDSYATEVDELVRSAELVGLVQYFPKGTGSTSPVTALNVSAESGILVVKSVHTYPNHNQVVLSTTRITRRSVICQTPINASRGIVLE